MAQVIHVGQDIKQWSLDRDDEGHRTYNVTWHVQAVGKEGPAAVLLAAGLPVVGSVWNFFGELDPWAFCTPYAKIRPVKQGQASTGKKTLWTVDQRFSTLPRKRCQDLTVQNPIAEPDQISGSFVNRNYKYDRDRNGNEIKTVSFEKVSVDYPRGYPTVRVKSNRLTLPLDSYSDAHNAVNSGAMWGLGPRQIRLDNITWERELYGQCFYYYPTTFEFDIDKDTFDLDDIPEEGEKVLDGHWDEDTDTWISNPFASAADPKDFIRYLDKNGSPARTYMKKNGQPVDSAADISYLDTVEISDEFNFFSLGMPATLA